MTSDLSLYRLEGAGVGLCKGNVVVRWRGRGGVVRLDWWPDDGDKVVLANVSDQHIKY